ncbi:MAG: hypothetical protein AB9835_08070 [Eubacteriales bacterium]
MLSLIIAIPLLLLFAVLTFLFNGTVLYIGTASIIPLVLVLYILYLSITEITFLNSGMKTLHTSDLDFLDYDERARMYKIRGQVFITGIIPQLYFIYSFNNITKTILSCLSMVLYFFLSAIIGSLSVRKMVGGRLDKEEAERIAQKKREELGKH